jgi:hypothetical protein
MNFITRATTLSAALWIACLPWRSSANAAPITYSFTAIGPITGSLGGIPITSSDLLSFNFSADTSTVEPFKLVDSMGNTLAAGYENIAGISNVVLQDKGTGTILATAEFLPSDGIFISIDNVNGGIGFGSSGALPTSPNFPGNPAYPIGLFTSDSAIHTYDLQGAMTFSNTTGGISCLGFPGSCVTPTDLATSNGDLVMGSAGSTFSVLDSATFTATVNLTPPLPMPEPATLGLVTLGLCGLGWARRKRQRISP